MAGIAVVTMPKGGWTRSVSGLMAVSLAPSWHWTTNVAVPAAVGVPDSVPEFESVTPEGREPPAIDQVYGDLPPAIANVVEYGLPRSAVETGDVVVTAKGAATRRTNS